MAEMVSEEQIKNAMDMIVKKNIDVPLLMSNMQNLSSVDHKGADLHEWLAGMTADGYITFMERLKRM